MDSDTFKKTKKLSQRGWPRRLNHVVKAAHGHVRPSGPSNVEEMQAPVYINLRSSPVGHRGHNQSRGLRATAARTSSHLVHPNAPTNVLFCARRPMSHHVGYNLFMFLCRTDHGMLSSPPPTRTAAWRGRGVARDQGTSHAFLLLCFWLEFLEVMPNHLQRHLFESNRKVRQETDSHKMEHEPAHTPATPKKPEIQKNLKLCESSANDQTSTM